LHFIRVLFRSRGGRQPDALVLEVIALSDRSAEGLLSAALQEARRQRQGGLVGVAEAVAAREPVLREKLRVVEVGERGIEERHLVLVAERHPYVEQPRLERLRQVLAEPARVALEDEPAVGAEPGDRGVRPGLLAGIEALEVVADVAQPRLRRAEPPRRDDRP